MLDAVSILRYKYRYRGYIHLVVLPGVRNDYLPEAAKLADRLSINLEAPNPGALSKLTKTKDYNLELLGTLKAIAEVDKEYPLRAGITTQFVVGACQESDQEILSTANQLYCNFRLKRVYYSGFEPVAGTPLEDISACPSLRQLRLYQADWLLRKYGFRPQELVFGKDGNLPQAVDPKTAYALFHPERFPVEINKADFRELIRVPGIGVIGAKKIIQARGREKIRNLNQLRAIGCSVSRARNFITLDGKAFPLKGPFLAPDSRTGKKTIIDKQLFFWEEF
jgi:predicted DNA-binding helix-hairpin-helix protein